MSGWAGGTRNNSAPLNSSGAERDLPQRRRVEIDQEAQKLLWDKQLMADLASACVCVRVRVLGNHRGERVLCFRV